MNSLGKDGGRTAPNATKLVKKRLAALAAVIIAIVVAALVGLEEEQPSDADSREVAWSGSTNPGDTDRRAVGKHTARKVTVPTGNSYRILIDVPDDQIRHRALEEFVEKRRIGAYRIVHINSDALRTEIRRANEQPTLELRLLDTSPVNLVARDAEEHSSGWQTGFGTWIGKVDGDDTSRASFVIAPDGSVNGVIRSLETGRVKIEPIKGTPYHMVWRLSDDFRGKID